MIWGLALEPGLECTTTTQDEVHLSLAAIESRTDPGKAGSYAQLLLKTDGAEQLLCTLVHGTIFQQCLDLKLMAGEKVTFTVEGSFGVFITGYSYKRPSTDVPTTGSEGSVSRNSITYKKQPHDKTGQQSDEELVSRPGGDALNGGSSNATAAHGEEEPMDSDNDRPHQTHATSLPPPVLSPRTAASGGNSPFYESSMGKSQTFDGASTSASESSHDMGSSSAMEPRAVTGSGDRFRFTSGTANPLQTSAGLTPQDNTDQRSSNHREIGLKPQLVSSDDKFVCPLCSDVFPGKDTLLTHEQRHVEDGEMFGCRYCHMVFVQKGNRNIHERIHSAMRHNIRTAFKSQGAMSSAPGEPKESPKSPVTTLDEVMSRDSQPLDEPEATPVTLSQSSPSPQPMEHSSYSEKPRPTKDRVRSRPYPTYSGLGLRTQGEEERNYRCQFCDKSFKRNYDRNRHERIHTGQKPYECSYCELAFSRREHCKKHEMTHLKTPDPLPPEETPLHSEDSP